MHDYSFLDSLGTMAVGMGGILIVCGIIILSVVVLNKVTSRKNKQKNTDDGE